MNISEFREAFANLYPQMERAGFELVSGAWRFVADDFVLLFEAPADKFDRAFQIRKLSVCLAHIGVPGVTGHPVWTFDSLDQVAPVQISPLKLRAYTSATYKDAVWHWVHPSKDEGPDRQCYLPVYYGGSAMAEKERAQRNVAIHSFGLEVVDNETGMKALAHAASEVASYAKYWGERMSRSEVQRQLKEYGGDWWFARTWLESYERAV